MEFAKREIQEVWGFGIPVAGYDPDSLRKDICGAWMRRENFGDHDSRFGWEIDRIISPEAGGVNEIFNLRPMQWENKKAKQGSELVCVVTAMGGENVKIA